jgi:Protein of unknown function (DUF2934)
MSSEQSKQESVRLLAYRFWVERGCPIGSPEVDWERAEQAVSESRQPATEQPRQGAQPPQGPGATAARDLQSTTSSTAATGVPGKKPAANVSGKPATGEKRAASSREQSKESPERATRGERGPRQPI